MKSRQATSADIVSILELFQKVESVSNSSGQSFFDFRNLKLSIESENTHWLLLEDDKSLLACVCLSVDPSQKISKISHIFLSNESIDRVQTLRSSLRIVIEYLNQVVRDIAIVYVTTQCISLEDHQVTLDEGFRILGVFPNVSGKDKSLMNGLAAYFYPGVLEEQRYSTFKLHESIQPFYELSRRGLNLPQLETDVEEPVAEASLKILPILEVITAEHFVLNRFKKLRTQKAQMNNFYPFRLPNCLITDPYQKIEIFVSLQEVHNFPAIIGERLDISVNPILLYQGIFDLLRKSKVTYIEIINDASDTYGIDCILKAGFTPSAYIPAFKVAGHLRRDFVIFGKTFENLCRPTEGINSIYNEFYKEYFKIEGKKYLGSTFK